MRQCVQSDNYKNEKGAGCPKNTLHTPMAYSWYTPSFVIKESTITAKLLYSVDRVADAYLDFVL